MTPDLRVNEFLRFSKPILDKVNLELSLFCTSLLVRKVVSGKDKQMKKNPDTIDIKASRVRIPKFLGAIIAIMERKEFGTEL